MIAVTVFVLIQLITYFAFASRRIPALALRYTPEHTHFAPGARFSWMLLNLEASTGLTGAQRAKMLSLFKEQYGRVYTDRACVPQSLLFTNSSMQFAGYKDGFSFSFRVLASGPLWVRVSHSDYEAPLAASSGQHILVWIMGFWVPVYNGPIEVS